MPKESRVQEARLDQQFALLVASLNTIKVLTILAEREASPKDLGETLGLSTPTASHHAKKLVRLGLVELVEERDVGGTIEHIYRAITRPLVNSKEWEKLELDDRQKYSLWIFQLILGDAAKSFAAQRFDVHPENHLSRTPLVADKEGLGELAGIQGRALEEIIEAQAKMAARMAETGEVGMNIIAAMTFFEIPEPSDGPASLWNSGEDPNSL